MQLHHYFISICSRCNCFRMGGWRLKMQELTAKGFIDQTFPIELPGLQNRMNRSGGGIGANRVRLAER
uniref:Uncharacterized protein n=1 Tax=Nelumbo nucifera TaxID=4432 RepID=A0A822YGS5_NELNU|nr:TPA_asm: hypothetical protein HUJ06_010631 [Nelumbo nucifera]